MVGVVVLTGRSTLGKAAAVDKVSAVADNSNRTV
jgi:hypothetical protein